MHGVVARMAPARACPAECGVDFDGVVLVVRRLDIVELLLVIRKFANHLLQAATASRTLPRPARSWSQNASMLLGRSCGMGESALMSAASAPGGKCGISSLG